jgi:GT2 family glycosyltransferase
MRKRLRARNRLHAASSDLPFVYLLWMESREEDIRSRLSEIGGWPNLPRFSILLYGEGYTDNELKHSVHSIDRQLYPLWDRLDARPQSRIAAQLASATGDFIVPLRVGDVLSEAALFRFAEALQSKNARILYGDQDEFDHRGSRTRPWFKPSWNEELFLAQDYLFCAVAIERDLAQQVCRQAHQCEIADLLLATTSLVPDKIVHVPHIVCHVGSRSGVNEERRVASVGRHLEARGATSTTGAFGTVKVTWPLPAELPLVSIIVPTKDKLSLLRPCIDGVLERTEYPQFEILIVDNGSVERVTADYLAQIACDPRVTVLQYPEAYNFSAINNFAVRHARGSFLCLLNNDTEVVEPGWLTEMMRYAVRPEIGAVGAKLLYDDGSIQHAGVVVGIGEAAGHAHRFLPADEPGYFKMPHVAHFVTAVTAACLVVAKDKFETVGGLDQDKFAVAFNDVDLCLKLQAAGWRNAYVPHAVLLHHESRSRGNDMSPLNIDRYRSELDTLQRRWGTKTYEDPLHNPNLDRYSETFVFRL